LEKAITEKTKAIILCSPSNPQVVFTQKKLQDCSSIGKTPSNYHSLR
jgi:aspartate/methionine/tyrosine aminotransferase